MEGERKQLLKDFTFKISVLSAYPGSQDCHSAHGKADSMCVVPAACHPQAVWAQEEPVEGDSLEALVSKVAGKLEKARYLIVMAFKAHPCLSSLILPTLPHLISLSLSLSLSHTHSLTHSVITLMYFYS